MENYMDEDSGHDDIGFSRKSGVITIGEGRQQRKYAWGLIWKFSNIPEEQDSIRETTKVALKDAAENHADLYCVPNKGYYGLATTNADQSIGMRPLGVTVASGVAQGVAALMAYEIRNHETGSISYYVVGVDNHGYVNPLTDILFDHEVDAKETFLSFMSTSEWPTLIAPSSWDISGAKEEDIDEALANARSIIKLKSTSSVKSLKRALPVIAVLLFCGGAWYGWGMWQDHQEEMQRLHQKQIEQRTANQKKAALARELSRQAWPYDSKVQGVAAIAMCESSMLATPILLPNYTFLNEVCQPDMGTVTVNYKAANPMASYSHVAQFVNAMTNMHPHIGHNKDVIAVVYNYRDVFNRPGYRYKKHEASASIDKQWSYIDSVFDSLHLSKMLAVTKFDPPPKKPNQQTTNIRKGAISPNDIDTMVFKRLHVDFNTSYTPSNFIKYLTPLHAFVLNSVEYNAEKKTWRVVGDIYEGIMQSVLDKANSPAKKK